MQSIGQVPEICEITHVLHELGHEKTCLCNMRTSKAQISLCIPAVWSVPLLFAA